MSEASLTEDAQALRAWWRRLLDEDPPTATTRALWFGLFETVDGPPFDLEGYHGSTFYVQGYPEFDADDETAQWATGEPSWTPRAATVRLPTLVEAHDWRTTLERALRLLEDLAPQTTWPGELDGIAAGFDDGDAHVVWMPAG